MTLRQYVPAVGTTFKMRTWDDYASRGIHIWANLKAHAVENGIVSFQVLNGSQPTNVQSFCNLSAVQAPLGWEPRYTIHCKPEQVQTVLGWFARGIVVRQSHNLSSSMPTAFQPMDNASQPHWQFPEVTDAIPAEQCAQLFRVVSVETEEITSATLGFPADTACSHCKGTGRRSLAALADIRQQTLAQVQALVASGEITVDDLTGDTFRCHCHYGAVSRLGRTTRGKLFKQMRADGWTVRYIPYAGGFWERQRETIVHDWQA